MSTPKHIMSWEAHSRTLLQALQEAESAKVERPSDAWTRERWHKSGPPDDNRRQMSIG